MNLLIIAGIIFLVIIISLSIYSYSGNLMFGSFNDNIIVNPPITNENNDDSILNSNIDQNLDSDKNLDSNVESDESKSKETEESDESEKSESDELDISVENEYHGYDMGLNEKKEVFNIDENKYTYEEAKEICKKFKGELATLSQIKNAYDNGANWCNYGWSADELALYPIQKSFYDTIEKTSLKGTCGKPGINGGKFDLKSKLGINCFGIRPKPLDGRLVYNTTTTPEPVSEVIEEETPFDINSIEIRPFSDNKWSNFSFKKSSYRLSDDILNNRLIQHDVDYSKLDPRIIRIVEQYPEDLPLSEQSKKLNPFFFSQTKKI